MPEELNVKTAIIGGKHAIDCLDLPDVMLIAEVASELRCSVTTIHREIRSGRLPVVCVGARERVLAGELREYLGASRVAG